MKSSNFFSILIVAVGLITVGCQNNKPAQEKVIEISNETNDVHSSQSSIDWEGTYFGTLPCASCPGINTLITLNKNAGYEKTVEYIGSEDIPKTTQGKFNWDKDGQIITIGEAVYLVAENQLFALDANHKKIEGELAEDYILTKIELEPALDANEGYTLQTFTGSDDKPYNVIFNTNSTIPTVLVETDGFQKTLTQTQAWAQGAEYLGSNAKLTIKGEIVVLTIKDHEIELKQQ